MEEFIKQWEQVIGHKIKRVKIKTVEDFKVQWKRIVGK